MDNKSTHSGQGQTPAPTDNEEQFGENEGQGQAPTPTENDTAHEHLQTDGDEDETPDHGREQDPTLQQPPTPEVPASPIARVPRRRASERGTRGEKSAERQVSKATPPPTIHRGAPSDDDDDRLTIPDILPVLPLKDTVIYPFSV